MVLHSVKKSLSIRRKESDKLKYVDDDEFESLLTEFKNVTAHCASMKAAIKGNNQHWFGVWQGISSTFRATSSSLPEGNETKKIAENGTTILAGFPHKEHERDDAAKKLLDQYINFVTGVQKKIAKRNSLVQELDYYRIKTAELQKKLEGNPKDSQKLSEQLTRSAAITEEMSQEFSKVNEETQSDMQRTLALKENVFACVLASYLAMQKQCIESLSGILQPTEECSSALDKWPSEADFHLDETKVNPNRIRSNSTRIRGKNSPNISPMASPKMRIEPLGIVTEDFEPREEGDLALKIGDELKIIKHVDENWAIGKLSDSGNEGLFPKCIVKMK